MKIALFSDIHLEHRNVQEWDYIVNHVVETAQGADLVVNAGDTHHSEEIRNQLARIFEANGFQYVSVMGNHDWYGHDWQEADFHTTEFGDLRVVHGTMWTDFYNDPTVEFDAERFISDFRYIEGVTASKMHDEFLKFRDYVEFLKPEIVVSHFAPSPRSIVDQWKGHSLNGYFCPNMLDQLAHRPKLWVHGHIHNPVDYEEDGVHVVANPLGYPRETYKRVQDYSCTMIEV